MHARIVSMSELALVFTLKELKNTQTSSFSILKLINEMVHNLPFEQCFNGIDYMTYLWLSSL